MEGERGYGIMSKIRANSSPQLVPEESSFQEPYDDSALQGVAANVKLLLKLIQDHKDACDKEKNDHRRTLRVATMMTILDNVRSRIQKCQSFGNKRSEAELRRCNTDLRHRHPPRDDQRSGEPVADDEKERLRKELNASLAAQKSLGIMCSSLGKEKKIMAAELSMKVHELSEMEELINDLKVQNETLREKVKECASQHKEKKSCGGTGRGEYQGNAALQERNKELSEQLLRSLDGYRSMKRKLKEAQEENAAMHATIDEMGTKVISSIQKLQTFKELLSASSSDNVPIDVQEEIEVLESMFDCFQMMVAKHDQKQGECVKPKGDINACKPSILA